MPKIQKKKNYKQLLFNCMFVFSLLVLMGVIVYSWFNTKRDSDVKDVVMSVEGSYNLRISRENGDSAMWVHKLEAFEKGRSFPLKAVCGNGTDFFSPVYGINEDEPDYVTKGANGEQYTVYKTKVTGLSDIPAEKLFSEYVYKLDFFFKIEEDSDLFISPLSSLTADIDASPKSILNDKLSTGHIAGATRVALFRDDGNEEFTPVLIWIPNSSTEFNESTVSVNEKGTPETEYTFTSAEEGTESQIRIETKGSPSGHVIKDGVIYCWGDIPSDLPAISSIDSDAENKYRAVIWVEGTDRECANALLGGMIKLDLKFSAEIEE